MEAYPEQCNWDQGSRVVVGQGIELETRPPLRNPDLDLQRWLCPRL